MPVLFTAAIKPTASIALEQQTVNLREHRDDRMVVRGRHDPCIAVRAVPVLEAVAAIGMLDQLKGCDSLLRRGRNEAVGYQGVEGSFSDEALTSFFGPDCPKRAYGEFEDVFAALQRGEIVYGVLPMENSSTGAIVEVYDLMRAYELYIVGEQYVGVNQNLLGLPGTQLDQLKEVYSHPQGFAQSSEFLKGHRGLEADPLPQHRRQQPSW